MVETDKPKVQRERSPSFPFIPLKAAVERLEQFEQYFGRHPGPADKAGLAWNMKGDSSQAQQTLAALKAYGFIDYKGSGKGREAVISDMGRTYLRAQQDHIKKDVLKRAAIKPKIIQKFWGKWGADRPPDPVCLDQLVLQHSFNENTAPVFLKVYDETIAYAGLSTSDKIHNVGEDADEDKEKDKGGLKVKVGDWVQWTSNGQDQFRQPRRVNWLSDDGAHIRVHGSMTGIATKEVTVVDPPAPPPAGAKVDAEGKATVEDGNDINVLLTSNGRLQITADVDEKGLKRLKEMLEKYEGILDLM